MRSKEFNCVNTITKLLIETEQLSENRNYTSLCNNKAMMDGKMSTQDSIMALQKTSLCGVTLISIFTFSSGWMYVGAFHLKTFKIKVTNNSIQ